MKNIIFLLVLVACVLTSCGDWSRGSTSQPSSSEISQTLGGEKINISNLIPIRANNCTFYIAENKIYQQKADCDDVELFINENDRINHMLVSDEQIYYSVVEESEIYHGERYKLFSIDFDGKNKECILRNLDIPELKDQPLVSWQMYNDKIYIQSNFAFFEYDIVNQRVKKLLEDVGVYRFYGSNLFYIDRSNRTFTLYKMDLNTGHSQIVVGTGRYNPTSGEKLISNFVITEDGRIFYTQRCPYGLFEYGQNPILIEDGDSILETSLAYGRKCLWYVIQTNESYLLIKYNVESQNYETFELNDYTMFMMVSDDGFFYKTKLGEFKVIT